MLHTYDPEETPFKPVLGTVESWKLSSTPAHIHHIHVNLFQITDIRDERGESIFDPDSACSRLQTDDSENAVLQYCDQKGIYRDTIFIRGAPANAPQGTAGYSIETRTLFERYIGTFVLHCHILDHENQGMMANVEVVQPGAAVSATGLITPASLGHAVH